MTHTTFSPSIWLAGTRVPFATASLTAALVAVGATFHHPAFSWTDAALAMLGVLFLHLSANTFNDWVDWNATDRVNLHAGPFNGGSRVRLEGKITRRAFFVMGVAFMAAALACGLTLFFTGRPNILWMGLLGAFLGAAYSLPPFSLQARGFGELAIWLAFGPFLTWGAGYAVTGVLSWGFFLVGLPAGLLTSAILYINQFPDHNADLVVGKHHWVVRLGTARARPLYLAMVVGAALITVALVAFSILPVLSLLSLIGYVPLVKAVQVLWRHHAAPRELVPAQQATIAAQALSQIILAVTLFV
ncbi:prenyltransferase [Myxococcota bacterium]|nr:prenyltransferase [Myxococcota bacterium]